MKSGIFTALILALFLSPASAHPRHYRHAPNPVAQSLGAGLLYMLQHKNEDPRHQWHDDWNYPNLIDVPPKGWPLEPKERVSRDGNLPGPCRQAARMGGPCGCWAASVLLGTTEHVVNGINLWLANDWRRFRHVSPGEANAVVWPGRHVAPVVAGSYDGKTITVRDSWSTHAVSTRGLVFVNAQL